MLKHWTVFCLVLLLFAGASNAQDKVLIGDVPLPADIDISVSDDLPFSGVWVGRWDNQRNHILIVGVGDESELVDVIYAVGSDQHSRGRWFERKAKVEGDKLVFADDGFAGRYTLSASGRLRGVFSDNRGFAILQRQELSRLLEAPDENWFSIGNREVLQTDLVENGSRINLSAVTYRPAGKGPFPLALVHHGSTGTGKIPFTFKQVWSNDWFADLLNARGWMVAFPQRRGRGGSDGLYDEGFSADRSQGYSPKAALSIPGAERALKDANAALEVLQKRSEVSPGKVLLGGVSRGGVVAILQAGDRPHDVAGVINFVGGWTSEKWGEATINPTLFRRIGGFEGVVLSIYGKEDQYYGVEHSKANLAEMEAVGANSQLHVVKLPGYGNGHWAIVRPNLWESVVGDYLEKLD